MARLGEAKRAAAAVLVAAAAAFAGLAGASADAAADRWSAGEPAPAAYAAVLDALDAYWAQDLARRGVANYRAPKVYFHKPEDFAAMTGDDGGVAYYIDVVAEIHIVLDESFNFMLFVLSHEFAHHVQASTGLANRLAQWQHYVRDIGAVNALEQRYELQAECLSGVWMIHAVEATTLVTAEDLREHVERERAYGDSPSHGAVGERLGWFNRGFRTRDIAQCDPFSQALD